jgi:hypothetical protein
MSAKTYTETPDEKKKRTQREKKKKYIQSDQPASKPGGATASP